MFQVFYNPLTNKNVTVTPTLLRDGIAGYSKDGTKIYVDVLVPVWMMNPLISHETLEMTLTQQLGVAYPEAHRQATTLEKYVCETTGIPWEQYDGAFHELMKAVAGRNPRPAWPVDMDVHV